MLWPKPGILPGPLLPDRIPAMKIRSITYFLDPSYPLEAEKIKQAGKFLKTAKPAFIDGGYEVQSARLAIVPFSQLIPDLTEHRISRFARQLEETAEAEGYAYTSLGPAMPEQSNSYELILRALSSTQNAFFSGSMTTLGGDISLRAIHQCAEVIHQASTISTDGFANLRFAALANVQPGSPFFPAAYHSGATASFALAAEAADLAVTAFSQATNLERARNVLTKSIEGHSKALTSIARQVENQTKVKFSGIDFSLAPFPSEERSLGAAFEQMGVPKLGNHGSLAAAAILADTIDRVKFLRLGFSGLLLPVLEDAILARRAAEGSLGIKDLLLYSAVCGTGLDTVPLPGDCTIEQLSALLLDVASLSSRLGKPLTARLMPIPGKKAGDTTYFNFDYFANSRVLSLEAYTLSRFLGGDETFNLHPRDTQ